MQAPLLALLSPLLATLLAQQGPEHRPCLSLPCTSSQLRNLLRCLVRGQEVEAGEQQELARLLGMGSAIRNHALPLDKKSVANINKIEHIPRLDILPQKIKSEQTKLKQDIKLPPEDAKQKLKENVKPLATLEKRNVINDSDTSKFESEEAVTKSFDAFFAFKCKICKNEFLSKKLLKEHKQIDHKLYIRIKSERVLCNFCSKTFSSKHILKSHISRVHDPDSDDKISEKALCNVCSKTFSNIYVLKTHIRTHEPNFKKDRSMCSECSRTFSTKAVLRKHILNEHSENKYTPCHMCGHDFTVFSIKKHLVLCNLSESERHERREKRKIKCNDCGKVLADKVKLRRHTRFIHNNEKLFKCNYCDHQDFRTDNLKVHIRNNHDGKDPNESFSRI